MAKTNHEIRKTGCYMTFSEMMDSVLIGDVHPLSFNMPRRYVPCLTSKVVAGFPSPADDHIEKHLDLNEHLVIHPQATFMLRVSGWSMRDAGIFDGDEIIVDRAISPEDGHVVVAIVNGEMTVKRLSMTSDGVCLMAAHPDFQPIGFQEGEELVIWGVVTRVLHKV